MAGAELRTKIVIDRSVFEDPRKTVTYLTERYLAGTGDVYLVFPRHRLERVEHAFDEIIRHHGMRNVNFIYEMVD